MLPLRAVFLSLSLCACGASTGVVVDAGRDAATVTDAPAADAPDARPQCVNVRECAFYEAPAGTRFGQGWACVNNGCTYIPRTGMTCYLQDNGCTVCDSAGPTACRGAACMVDLSPARVAVESQSCGAGFALSDVVACFGPFATLANGTPCLLTEAPTGAIRYVLSCGPCEVVFTPR
ncbi:MAG: hypothetical protein R3A52_01230 [Polyangiales bacterium]